VLTPETMILLPFILKLVEGAMGFVFQ